MSALAGVIGSDEAGSGSSDPAGGPGSSTRALVTPLVAVLWEQRDPDACAQSETGAGDEHRVFQALHELFRKSFGIADLLHT